MVLTFFCSSANINDLIIIGEIVICSLARCRRNLVKVVSPGRKASRVTRSEVRCLSVSSRHQRVPLQKSHQSYPITKATQTPPKDTSNHTKLPNILKQHSKTTKVPSTATDAVPFDGGVGEGEGDTLERALRKAVESGDTDLVYLVLFHIYR